MTDLGAVRSRIEAARELAVALLHLTPGGQTFAMKRIMGLLTDDVHHCLAGRLDEQRQRWLIADMERLAHEAARSVPDVKAFHPGITVVLDALLAVTQDATPSAPTPVRANAGEVSKSR